MALAVAASASIPMRSVMASFRLSLVLAVLGCAEPTASYQGPAPPAVLEAVAPSNSYSISSIDRTVRVSIATVRLDGGDEIRAFIQRVFESADAAGARRMVLDLRAISGSDAFLVVPLLKGVIARDHLRAPGGLVVIVGPDSYAATQNAATLLGQYAKPVFAR